MERKRNFDIHFVGLKNSTYTYEYEIGASFFKMYEVSSISESDLKVKLEFQKKDSFFILNFQVDGTVNLPCDRCCEQFDYELITDFEIIVKFDEVEEGMENEGDVIFISRSDTSLNVADIIYDYILVNIPIQVIHPNDEHGNSTCNPEILKKLIPNQKIEDDIDPRWLELSKIKT